MLEHSEYIELKDEIKKELRVEFSNQFVTKDNCNKTVKDEDLVALENILSSNIFERPTIKMSIYKNRRGRYKGVILWCKADLGTCRIKPMFCTSWDYELINLDNIKIVVEESAF